MSQEFSSIDSQRQETPHVWSIQRTPGWKFRRTLKTPTDTSVSECWMRRFVCSLWYDSRETLWCLLQKHHNVAKTPCDPLAESQKNLWNFVWRWRWIRRFRDLWRVQQPAYGASHPVFLECPSIRGCRVQVTPWRLFDISRETRYAWIYPIYSQFQEYSKNVITEARALAGSKIVCQCGFGKENCENTYKNTTLSYNLPACRTMTRVYSIFRIFLKVAVYQGKAVTNSFTGNIKEPPWNTRLVRGIVKKIPCSGKNFFAATHCERPYLQAFTEWLCHEILRTSAMAGKKSSLFAEQAYCNRLQ